MKHALIAASVLSVLMLGASVPAATAQAPVSAGYVPPRTPGYLVTAGAVPDTRSVVTPPPAMGSLNESRDRTVFLATRALLDTPRGRLATTDAVQNPKALTEDFFCTLGFSIDPAKAPVLTRLLDKTMSDASPTTNGPKDFFKRPRPFVLYGGPICTEGDREGLAANFSYPSGHTTVSWAYGLILAELFPDKGPAILARARAYGESRVVCGVHSVSDVESGRVNGSALVAALHANPEFEADFRAAKAEVAALRRSPAPLGDRQAVCAVELEAAANRPW